MIIDNIDIGLSMYMMKGIRRHKSCMILCFINVPFNFNWYLSFMRTHFEGKFCRQTNQKNNGNYV